MRQIGYFIIGAVSGSLLGAGIAIMFAPSSGGELRENIKACALQSIDDVKSASLQRREELEDQLARLRSGGSLKLE